MTKIVLVWWVISSTGAVTQPIEWDGWLTMKSCEIALESFTAPNPKATDYKYGIIGKCVEVHK